MKNEAIELIKQYQLPITIIPENRRYWFFRTQGGEFYKEFLSQGFIALGFNEFNDVKRLLSMSQKDAYAFIELEYGDKHKPGKVYNQIKKFSIDMQPHDIVIIPGTDTQVLQFGEITSDLYVASENATSEDICKYQKRRKINWIKNVHRDDLDPYLHKITRPHNTISEVKHKDTHFIDRTLYSVFIKGEESYCYLDVTKEAGIRTTDFFPMGNDLLCLLQEFQDYSGIELYLHNLETKVNLQSKGKLGFKGFVLTTGVIAVITFVILTGGKFEMPAGLKFENNSMFQKVSEFLNEKQRRNQKEELFKKLENMKVATPEEMKIIELQIKLILEKQEEIVDGEEESGSKKEKAED